MNRGKRIAVIAAVVLAGATGLACGGGGDPSSSSGKPVTEGSATGPATTTTAKAAAKVPAAKDFKIAIKVLTKDCFGSAGCNLTYRINAVTVPAGLDPGTTYEVSYKVTGAEDPKEGTLTISGGKFDTSSISDELAQVKSKNAKLTATATAVEIV